jgi:hypothetical protein
MSSKKKSEKTAAAAATDTTRVGAEEFVKVWQGCKTLDEAKTKLGKFASSRATRFRANNVDLQKFTADRTLDYAALAKLAKAEKKGE